MRLNAYNSTAPRANYQYRTNKNNAQSSQPSFGASKAGMARQAFEWLGEKCDIAPNGSLTRAMFFVVATVFMLGGRFFESRSNDEKREVVTRDVPAVALSVAGAPLLNQAAAYTVTKSTGVPIVTLGEKKNLLSAAFRGQKDLVNWYSDLSTADNALVNFSQTIDKNGGNLQKVFKKLGFTDMLKAITDKTDNKGILEAINNAKANGSDEFKALENALKAIPKDNNLVKFAKKSHAYVKLGGIAFMAATLGYFLPHLNIVTTKKKYQKKLDDGKINQETFDLRMQRTSPVFRVSSGILSFHRSSAKNTFRNLLSMMDAPNKAN